MQEKTDKELYKEFLLGNNESFEKDIKIQLYILYKDIPKA